MWLYFFEIYPEFMHRPQSERREAAYHAQQKAMHHWQVWLSLVLMVGCVVGFSTLERALRLGDENGTVGAMFDFLLGGVALHWAFYRCGLPYYREAMLKRPPEN